MSTMSGLMQSTRERMLARLAGMDLSRVFDPDKTGFIDPIVLARSLKMWDAAVFTDENVDDFLKWSNLEKEPGAAAASRSISIQDMVGFVKAHCRLPRRSNSRAAGSVASGASEATGATESFSAAPRSLRTREPRDESASRTGSRAAERTRSASRPPLPALATQLAAEAPAAETTEPAQEAPPAETTELAQELAAEVAPETKEDSQPDEVVQAPPAEEAPQEEPKEEAAPPPAEEEAKEEAELELPPLEQAKLEAAWDLSAVESTQAPAASSSGLPPAPRRDLDGSSAQLSGRPKSSIGLPSQKLVDRLAGLNILRVLDVDGNGLIDREVLKSALSIFDPEIFTEEGVEQLIHAATRTTGIDDGTHIRILDLAMYMGTPIFYPLTPPPIQEGDEEDDQGSIGHGGYQSKAASSIPRIPLHQTQEPASDPVPLTAAEEMLFYAALDDQSDLASSCVMLTARTEIESIAAEPDTVHVAVQELKAGSSGCSIKSPELRGITLRQLQRLMTYVEEHCERESWYDPETGNPLTAESVDLFCLREWVLKPATKERRCSFVELIALRASEQRPKWYVSHCAGSVMEFVKCLREHAQRHGFDDDIAYWVDAYAANPWQDEHDGGVAWEKALAVSQGTVQIIGSGPVAYLEVGSHSLYDVDTEPFYGMRFSS
mmetsp:Transcript_78842/g.225850  ORF Transcript_78842/g.225850 Transcript_78842/m.225850 type:complete len:663 (+) Transcript_78842:30-2018(+)